MNFRQVHALPKMIEILLPPVVEEPEKTVGFFLALFPGFAGFWGENMVFDS